MKYFMLMIVLLFWFSAFSQSPEEKLKAQNIQLPAIPKPIANYVNAVRSGNLIFLSGKGTL